jgi:hypothetical protein
MDFGQSCAAYTQSCDQLRVWVTEENQGSSMAATASTAISSTAHTHRSHQHTRTPPVGSTPPPVAWVPSPSSARNTPCVMYPHPFCPYLLCIRSPTPLLTSEGGRASACRAPCAVTAWCQVVAAALIAACSSVGSSRTAGMWIDTDCSTAWHSTTQGWVRKHRSSERTQRARCQKAQKTSVRAQHKNYRTPCCVTMFADTIYNAALLQVSCKRPYAACALQHA